MIWGRSGFSIQQLIIGVYVRYGKFIFNFFFFPDSLAHIMNDLFGGVVYAGIDTDRFKYPIGSGRVTFGNQRSFMKAVKAGFVDIKTTKFTKKVCLCCVTIVPRFYPNGVL